MLHTLLFLTAQLFVLNFSTTLSPMTPAEELSTTTTTTSTALQTTTTTTTMPARAITQDPETVATSAAAVENNVLVFLNESIYDPQDNVLRNDLYALITGASSTHIVAPVETLKKVYLYILEQILYNCEDFLSDPLGAKLVENYFYSSSIYFINNSSYCIIVPRNTLLKDCDQKKLLDLSECTPLCEETEEKDYDEGIIEFLNKLLHNIEINKEAFLLTESTILHQLFRKQIEAHDFFDTDKKVDYSSEQEKLASQSWTFYFTGHGFPEISVAGFTFETGEIWETLKLLNHISTNYLIINSCYAGGVNREILTGNNNILFENFCMHKKLWNYLKPSYKIILCSPTNAPIKTNSGIIVNEINSIATQVLSEENLIKIFNKSLNNYSDDLQANLLPLILRPHQDKFQPFFTTSIKNKRALLANNEKNHAEKSPFSLVNKTIIGTDQAIILPDIILNPIITQHVAKKIKKYGHEDNLFTLFPVINDVANKELIRYPFFLSLQAGDAYHYLNNIKTGTSVATLPGERGVFLCLRNLFFNANMRRSFKFYFIKNITGENDLPKAVVKNIFDQNFPQSGEMITLENVAIGTFYGNLSDDADEDKPTNCIDCCFSYKECYYSFFLKINDKNDTNEWAFIKQLSQEEFINKICKMERITCSTIYDRLKSYPASHPQHNLIKQYLNGEKSIFLDFENSYPLFKDAHLPEDDNAWEKISELVKKHKEILGDLAGQQLNDQQRFTCIMNKLKQHRELNEMQALLPTLAPTKEI